MYYCAQDDRPDYTKTDLASCKTPKIQKQRCHSLENWLNMYPDEIRFIIDHYIQCIMAFSSSSYFMSLDLNQLRKDLIKKIYLTSDNRLKSFAA